MYTINEKGVHFFVMSKITIKCKTLSEILLQIGESMKKVSRSVNKFSQYANHLKSLTVVHKSSKYNHNINIDSMIVDMENFYALNPEFFVKENNAIMRLLNDDYTNYLKWMVNDRN